MAAAAKHLRHFPHTHTHTHTLQLNEHLQDLDIYLLQGLHCRSINPLLPTAFSSNGGLKKLK